MQNVILFGLKITSSEYNDELYCFNVILTYMLLTPYKFGNFDYKKPCNDQ